MIGICYGCIVNKVPKQAIIIITYIDFSISKLDETEVWAWATLNNY